MMAAITYDNYKRIMAVICETEGHLRAIGVPRVEDWGHTRIEQAT